MEHVSVHAHGSVSRESRRLDRHRLLRLRANFTLPSIYHTVANYNLALSIVLPVMALTCLFLVAFLRGQREVLAVNVFCTAMALESCVALPLLVLFVHVYHELVDGAVSWHIEQGGREIIAAVTIVLTETVLVFVVSGYHWCKADSEAEADVCVGQVEQPASIVINR